MKISLLTLFPEMFHGVLEHGLLRIAREKALLDTVLVNIRGFADNKHSQTDDYAFGGGPGMLMMPQPAIDAITHAQAQHAAMPHRVYLSPRGQVLTQKRVREMAKLPDLLLICGHYEGMDERVLSFVDEEISVGDYILSGGEIPAMALIDAIARCIPGALGNGESLELESHEDGLLEYPQYTRPADFRGLKVPEVLLNGNHAAINAWRRQQSLLKTLQTRPELLERAELTEAEREWLERQA